MAVFRHSAYAGLIMCVLQLFFAGYNKKFGQDGMHEPLVWDKYQVWSVCCDVKYFHCSLSVLVFVF